MSSDQEPKAVIFPGEKQGSLFFLFVGTGAKFKEQFSRTNAPGQVQILAEPPNISPSPQEPMPPAHKIVSPSTPLRKEYEVTVPSRRNCIEGGRSTGEIPQRRASGRERFQLTRWVTRGATAVLILGSIYLVREPISEAADSFANLVTDGMDNQPGQQTARKSYSEHKSYINLEDQLNAQREAAEIESDTTRQSIQERTRADFERDQREFLNGIDEFHKSLKPNPHK